MKKVKRYRFSDEMIIPDTIISLIFGGLGLITIIGTVIFSIVKKGNTGDTGGLLLLAAGIMTLTGLIFSGFSYHNYEGGVLSKRTSLILGAVDTALIILIVILGGVLH